jgi:hypothetical protein
MPATRPRITEAASIDADVVLLDHRAPALRFLVDEGGFHLGHG